MLQRDFWQRFVLRERSALRRYAVALALACGSLVLVHLLNRVQGVQVTSLAFASVVLSAIYGGLGPGLLDAAITAVGIDYYFTEPRYEAFTSWASVLRLAVYGGVGVVIASIVSSMRTAYRELHRQYSTAEREKGAREKLLAIVSHDLRSPLTVILMGIAELRRTPRPGEHPVQGRDVLDGLQRSAELMRRLVDDLLDAAKIERGSFTIAPATHDIAALVEETAKTMRLSAAAKRVRIDCTVPPREILVECDRERLIQVLGNLLGNAIKFAPADARVELALAEDAEAVQISVHDPGPGIRSEELPLVFAPYWQASGAAPLGAGLGLFIVKGIVEAHRGRVDVRSAPGEGATFIVTLPRSAHLGALPSEKAA